VGAPDLRQPDGVRLSRHVHHHHHHHQHQRQVGVPVVSAMTSQDRPTHQVRAMTPRRTQSLTAGSCNPPPRCRWPDMQPTDEARELAEAGWTQQAIADRLSIAQSTVSRLLAGDHDAQGVGACEQAIDALADSLRNPDVQTVARVEAARVLACRLDWARGARSGAGAIAAAGLARELDRLVDAIGAGQPNQPDQLDALQARRARRLAARAGVAGAGDLQFLPHRLRVSPDVSNPTRP